MRSTLSATRRAGLMWACVGLLVAFASSTALAQPAQTLPPSGSEILRGLLKFHGIEPVSLNEPDEDYSRLIVIVYGVADERDPRSVHPSRIVQRTLLAGGSVLIAADGPTTLPGYFPDRTKIEIPNEIVLCPLEAHTLHRNPFCPFLIPKAPSSFEESFARITGGAVSAEWSLFQGRRRIAANITRSILVNTSSKYVLNPLAGFPAGSIEWRTNDPIPETRAFAVGGTGTGDQPFRCLVLADQSVFSNQMTAAPDTDNLLFANAVVEWLRGPDRRRNRCLFIEGRTVQNHFPDVLRGIETPPPPLPPLPPLPSPFDPKLQRNLTELGDEALARVDEQAHLDRVFGGDGSNDRRYERTLLTLTMIAAVLAAMFLIRRIWNGKHQADLTAMPKGTGAFATLDTAGTLARRREEILQSGQYTELVREYIQELFVAQGLSADQLADPPLTLPKVTATGPNAKAVRAGLRILWEVAFTKPIRPITYSRWKELEPMLDEVRTAARKGRWHFPTGEQA